MQRLTLSRSGLSPRRDPVASFRLGWTKLNGPAGLAIQPYAFIFHLVQLVISVDTQSLPFSPNHHTIFLIIWWLGAGELVIRTCVILLINWWFLWPGAPYLLVPALTTPSWLLSPTFSQSFFLNDFFLNSGLLANDILASSTIENAWGFRLASFAPSRKRPRASCPFDRIRPQHAANWHHAVLRILFISPSLVPPWACLPAGGWSSGRRPCRQLGSIYARGSHRLHFFWYTPGDHWAEIRIPCEAFDNANKWQKLARCVQSFAFLIN